VDPDLANNGAPLRAPLVRPPTLRRVEHPELSPWLIHYCDRGRPLNDYVDKEIREMGGSERLASILWDGYFRAFRVYSQGDPVVCFSEATRAGITFFMRNRSYQPWGLIVDRDSVYRAGGGPVWYARTTEYKALPKHPSRFRSWAVELAGHKNDWLEEREWRIPREPQVPKTVVELSELQPVGVLVGDPDWAGVRWADSASGELPGGYVSPPASRGLLRYWWDSSSAQLRQLATLF
jgi:hypothetical protein